MIRNLIVCGAVTVVALGCGSDDDENADTARTTDTGSVEEATGDLEAWCLGWTSETTPSDVQTPEDFQAFFEASLARTEALLNVAPDEIADTNATMLEAQQVLGDYLAENDWDLNSPRLDPELAENSINVSAQEMETFAAENC